MAPTTHVTLRNGLAWPLLGLGTYRLTPADIPKVVDAALESKYGLIDTAVSYRFSHGALPSHLREQRCARRPEWIQTKIPPSEQGYDRARECALRCIDELRGCASKVCILLHWPGGSRLPPDSPEHSRLRLGSWLALQELYDAGAVQAIGVSNFLERHLRELEAAEGVTVLPHVNQVELHPALQQRQLRAFCATKAVHVQAYSSLGQGSDKLAAAPPVQRAARRRGATEAQVLLLWATQQHISVLPRSHQPFRVRQNAAAITVEALTDTEQAEMAAMEDGTKFCWDPTGIR